MARRSSGSHIDEALDLFLDTISNVFGGIIFVAMLVVLLLQLTPESPVAQRDEAGATALMVQVAALERVTGVGNGAARAEMVALVSRQGELQHSVEAEHERVESLRNREAEAEQATLATAEELERTRQQIAAAEAELIAVRARSAGRLRVPHFRSTDKREFALLVSQGRVASLLTAAGVLNAPHIEILEPESRVRLKPGGGDQVTKANAEDLARRLGPANGAMSYVSLAVWPDSFAEATLLRDALITRGIDYNLILLPEGGSVKTAALSGVQ